MKNEIWKPVVGFEGMYEVSSLGRVRSVDRVITMKNGVSKGLSGRLLKLLTNPYGYYYVNLKQKSRMVHRLVYETFAGTIPKGYDIHHLDGNKTNNVPENLALLAHGKHTILTHKGRHISRQTKHKISKANKGKLLNRRDLSKVVNRYTLDGNMIDSFCSTMDAHRKTGISAQNIGACANGKIKSAGGYLWKYPQ